MAEFRRRISGLNSEQVMHAMGIDDAYHVERVLVRSSNGVTELVTIEGAGPFVRKKMPLDEVNRSVWAAIAGNDCARLPQVAATYEMPDCFAAVYDYVPGETLEDVMARSDALDVGSAVQLATDVCEALAALHRRGVMHLDIAPRNIIVAADGAHVIDFGNARLIADSGDVHGEAVRPKGTWGFAAPEQFFSRASVRSDVFAVGRLLGYMLTGIQPDDDRISAFETALRDESRVPASLRGVIERAIGFEPSARYQRIEDLAAALEDATGTGAGAGAGAGIGAGAGTGAGARTGAGANAAADPGAAAAPAAAAVSAVDAAPAAAATPGAAVKSADRRPVSVLRIATLVLAIATALMGLVVAYRVLVQEVPVTTGDAAADGADDRPGDAAADGADDGLGDAAPGGDVVDGVPDGEPIMQGGSTQLAGEPSQGDLQRAADALGIAESGWSVDPSGCVRYAITLENTSDDLIIEFPEVIITGRSASGSIVFSSSQVMGVVFPNSTLTFACMEGNGTAPASVDFTLAKPKDYGVSIGTGRPTEYKMHDVAARRGANDKVVVTGEVEKIAEGDEFISGGDVRLSVVLRDDDGAIVSGSNGFVTSPGLGERMPFSITIYDCPEYATLEVVPLAN